MKGIKAAILHADTLLAGEGRGSNRKLPRHCKASFLDAALYATWCGRKVAYASWLLFCWCRNVRPGPRSVAGLPMPTACCIEYGWVQRWVHATKQRGCNTLLYHVSTYAQINYYAASFGACLFLLLPCLCLAMAGCPKNPLQQKLFGFSSLTFQPPKELCLTTQQIPIWR